MVSMVTHRQMIVIIVAITVAVIITYLERLSILSIEFWLLDCPSQRPGRISRIICADLGLFVSHKFSVRECFTCSSGTTEIVDYTNYDDMKYAIKILNRSEFQNVFSHSTIRVKEHDSRGRSRNHFYSREKSASRSCSRSYNHSQSRSKSPKAKSPKHARCRSRSISSQPRSWLKGRSVSRY